jgi:hypothetical protein
MTGILDWLHRRSLPQACRAASKLRTLEDTVYGFHRQEPAAVHVVASRAVSRRPGRGGS